MKRVNGKLEETTWKDALGIVASKLKGAGDRAGFISTAGMLNQDAFVLSKLASDVIKTKNIDSTASLYVHPESMKSSDKVDIDAADAIVVAGLNPSQWERVLPALDAAVRKRAARGAKLIVINSGETRLASAAAVSITADEAGSLGRLAKALIDKGQKADKALESAVSGLTVSEDVEKAAEILSKAASPVIFCSPSLFTAARNLSLVLKISVAAVPYEANARGVVSMGVVSAGKSYADLAQGGVDVLYAVGEVPVTKRPNTGFLIAQTSYMTDLAREADIVLPAATYLESKGTIINYLGKIKDVAKVVNPAGSSKQHRDIFIDLSKALNNPIKESSAQIKAAFEVSAKPSFNPFEKKQGLDVDPADLIESINVNVTRNSKLAWFKEALEAAAK